MCDSKAAWAPVENRAATAITVVDQKAWRFAVPVAAFDDLLGRPFRRRMLGHLDMRHFAVGGTNYEEGMKSLEP